jgi:hypothetical protein
MMACCGRGGIAKPSLKGYDAKPMLRTVRKLGQESF